MTKFIEREAFGKAFYDEMTVGETPQRTQLRQALTVAGAAPVSANLLENAQVQQDLLKARKPGVPSNYPTKGDYTFYVNPVTKVTGDATVLLQGGRGNVGLPAYKGPFSFIPDMQTNKPFNPELGMPDTDIPGMLNRISLVGGFWSVQFNFTLGFRPSIPGNTGTPRLLAGGMHATVQFLCEIKSGTSASRYAPMFEKVINRASFPGGTTTPFSGSFEVQLDANGYLDFTMMRSPTIGYYGSDNTNPESIGLIKITPTEAVQDPSEDIGNYLRLIRLA